MRVLVACEYSGRVRDAFRSHGHDAWSCDLLPTEVPGPHFMGPVEHVLTLGWDLMIAHPPCTYLAVSGMWATTSGKRDPALTDQALDFVRLLMAAPIGRWCIENPVSVISSTIRKPDQIIQPWEFGHGEVKATCLWLHNLPKLRPTDCVDGRDSRVLMMPPSADRWKDRSRTYQGIANAMAAQWGAKNFHQFPNSLRFSRDLHPPHRSVAHRTISDAYRSQPFRRIAWLRRLHDDPDG